MPRRIDQVNKELFRLISELIARHISFKPGIFATVTKVDTSPDLRYAQVFVSIFPQSEDRYAMTALDHQKGVIRHGLSQELSMHHIPDIIFHSDHTAANADNIEHIIKQIHEEDAQ